MSDSCRKQRNCEMEVCVPACSIPWVNITCSRAASKTPIVHTDERLWIVEANPMGNQTFSANIDWCKSNLCHKPRYLEPCYHSRTRYSTQCITYFEALWSKYRGDAVIWLFISMWSQTLIQCLHNQQLTQYYNLPRGRILCDLILKQSVSMRDRWLNGICGNTN